MKKERSIKKWTSRKFILASVTDFAGVLTMLIGEGTLSTIIGAVMVITATVLYCLIEGVIDAKSVVQITDAVQDIAEELCDDKSVVDAIRKIGLEVESSVDKPPDDNT